MCLLFPFSCKWENNDRSSIFSVCGFRLSFIITISYAQNQYYSAQKQMWWDEWVGGQEMRVWIISLIREIEDRCSARKGVSASLKECGATSQSLFVGAVCILPLVKIQTQTVMLPTYLHAFWNSMSPLSLDVSVFGNPPTEQPTFITVKKKPFCRKMAVMLSLYLLGWYLEKKNSKMNYTVSSPRAISCRHRKVCHLW